MAETVAGQRPLPASSILMVRRETGKE